MRAGDAVEYRSGRKWVAAAVVAHTDTGASGWKVLTLAVGNRIIEDVPHEADAASSKPCWREARRAGDTEVGTEATASGVPLKAKAGKGRATSGVGGASEK